MTNIRSKIVGVAVLIIILMGIFPPWSVTGGVGSNYPGVVFSLGYHPIFMAPLMGEISASRLFIQWLLVVVVAGSAIYFENVVRIVLANVLVWISSFVASPIAAWRKHAANIRSPN